MSDEDPHVIEDLDLHHVSIVEDVFNGQAIEWRSWEED